MKIQTTPNASTYGGSRATYIKYELTNVQVTALGLKAPGTVQPVGLLLPAVQA